MTDDYAFTGADSFASSSGLALLPHGTSAGNTTEMRFRELAANGTHYVAFKAADALETSTTWILPNADADGASQALTSDGSASLDWKTVILPEGTNAFTGDQSMGTNKLTNVKQGTAAADAARFDDTAHDDFSWTFMWQSRATVDTGSGTLSEVDTGIDSPTDYDGYISVINMSDGNAEAVAWSFFVPSQLDLTKAVDAIFYYRVNSSNTGDIEIGATARAVAAGEHTKTGGALFSPTAVVQAGPGTVSLLQTATFTAIFGTNTLGRDDFVKGVFSRDATGGNATDTFTGICQAVGIKFVGKRRRAA